MTGRRTSYLRLDELMDKNASRNSRVDQVRSHIPVPHAKKRFSSSLDRMSGVYQMDSSSRHTIVKKRNRSVDSSRRSQIRGPSGIYLHSETPVYRTPMNNPRTPMTGASTTGASTTGPRTGQPRTPSNNPIKGHSCMFEIILSGVQIKDCRPVTDPAWLKEKGQDVLRKLRKNEATAELLPSGGAPLKPITIRLFLDLTKALLMPFHDEKGLEKSLSANVYIDELPNIARSFGYPGVMTKSWLRSVNAGHTYPNMLAFLSYLVDLVEIKNIIKDDMGFETLYGTGDDGILYTMRHQLYFNSWSAYQVNKSNPQDDFNLLEDEYIEELKKQYKCSDDELENLREELHNIQEKEKEMLAENAKLQEKEKSLISESTSIKNRSHRLKQMEVELNDQLLQARMEVEKEEKSFEYVETSIESLQNEIKMLEEQLSRQTMTLKDKDEILKEVNYLNECTNANNTLLMELTKASFENDIVLATEQKRALTASMTVNKYLMEVGLAAGKDLSCYSIKERELLKSDTLDIFNNTIEHLKMLKSEAELQLEKMRQEKDSELSHKLKLQNDIESNNELLKKLQTKHEELSVDVKEKKTQFARLKQHQEEVDSKLKTGKESKNTLERVYNEKKKEYDHWKIEISKWNDLIERMNQDTEELEEKCKKASEDIVRKYIEKANSIIPKVPHFQSVF